MLLKELLRGLGDLEGGELVALLLEAADDLADEAALDAVGPAKSVCYTKEETCLCRGRYVGGGNAIELIWTKMPARHLRSQLTTTPRTPKTTPTTTAATATATHLIIM